MWTIELVRAAARELPGRVPWPLGHAPTPAVLLLAPLLGKGGLPRNVIRCGLCRNGVVSASCKK